MTENKWYSGLQRLFSTGVVVRRIGKGKLKVVDTSSLQGAGGQKGSKVIDRYGRIYNSRHTAYSYGRPGGRYPDTLNNRLELYTDYEAMSTDSILSSALDIFSDESSTRDLETGDILNIKSKNENTRQILENLFYDILNIDHNLWWWIRNLVKYGDFYLQLNLNPEYGVVNAEPLSSYDVIREEIYDDQTDQFKIKFLYQGADRRGEFQYFEIAHFRMLMDSNFLPYGKSILEGARKTWKALCLRGDTKIWTPTGHTEIKDMKEGDSVYSYDYDNHEIIPAKVVKWKDNGLDTIYEIKTTHKKIYANGSHPFMTSDGTYKRTLELTTDDYLVSPKIKQSEINHQSVKVEHEMVAKLDDLGVLIAEEKIQEQDNLVECVECGVKYKQLIGNHLAKHDLTPTTYKEKHDNITHLKNGFLAGKIKINLDEAIKTCKELNIPEERLDVYNKYSTQKIVDENLLKQHFKEFVRFFGFMLGDGWQCENTISFSLGDRRDKSDKYVEFINKIGLKTRIAGEGMTSATCRVDSKYFSLLMKEYGFKTGCLNKEVPDWVFKLSNDLQHEFIMGFIDADGCVVENTWSLGGINKHLLEQLRTMAQRIGLFATNIVIYPGGRERELNGKKFIAKAYYSFAIRESTNRIKQLSDGCNAERVTSVTEIGEDEIYDIQVDNDLHNFIAEGIVAHNTLMEDAMLINRIMRAPERRIIKVDIGNLKPDEVDGYMEKVMNKMKKVPYIDESTGELNMKFNLMPCAWYTKIPLLDGRIITIKELSEECDNGKKNYVYSVDKENKIVSGKVLQCSLTKKDADITRVTLDDDSYIDFEPNHPVMLRNGEYKAAKDLVENESLMPFYTEELNTKIKDGIDHKVKSVESLSEKDDVYCMEVKDFHNFAIDSHEGTNRNGIFVKNSMMEDVFLAVRGDKSGTQVDTLAGLEWNAIDDIEYLKCLRGDTKIKLLDGTSKTIKYITDNFEKGKFHTLSVNPNNLYPESVEIVDAKQTIRNAKLVRVILDNNKHIDCTLEHRFMLRDGSYKEAQYLKEADFLMPTSDIISVSKVEFLEEIDDTYDIEVLKNSNFALDSGIFVHNSRMIAALKIPKAFLGYEEGVEGKCLAPDTEIQLLNGEILTIKEIADKFIEDNNTNLWCYSFDFKTNSVVPTKIKLAEKTRRNAQIVRVHIDNDTYVDCTPDHHLILSGGTEIQAQDLKEGDSLQTGSQQSNYKVVRVEWLTEKIDTYNMEVDNENHNYLLSNGIVIKNSTLSILDIRFSRTIEMIQRIVVSELTKIAIIHLFLQGYKGADLVEFDLELTNPSIIYEQEKVSLLSEKFTLVSSMQTTGIISQDKMYKEIFDMSEDEIKDEKKRILDDYKWKFRLAQIEAEGNDPAISGESYGTPHDLAAMSVEDEETPEKPDINVPKDKNEPGQGRPEEPTHYGAQEHPDGRDPLAKKDIEKSMEPDSSPLKHNFRGGPLALQNAIAYKNKKMIAELYDKEEEDDDKFLDESNIIDD